MSALTRLQADLTHYASGSYNGEKVPYTPKFVEVAGDDLRLILAVVEAAQKCRDEFWKPELAAILQDALRAATEGR